MSARLLAYTQIVFAMRETARNRDRNTIDIFTHFLYFHFVRLYVNKLMWIYVKNMRIHNYPWKIEHRSNFNSKIWMSTKKREIFRNCIKTDFRVGRSRTKKREISQFFALKNLIHTQSFHHRIFPVKLFFSNLHKFLTNNANHASVESRVEHSRIVTLKSKFSHTCV